MPTPINLLSATKICIVPVWRRPEMLGAAIAAVTRAQGFRDWGFIFSLDRGVDPACLPTLEAFPGIKLILRQPQHPYPGNTYNVLAAMKSAVKLPAAQILCYLPEDYLVAPTFFSFHERAWKAALESTPANLPQPVMACAIHASDKIAGRSWQIARIKLLLDVIGEAFFLFSPTYMKKTWPTAKTLNGKTIDQIIAAAMGTIGIRVNFGEDLAQHVGFFTDPTTPAGLRWKRESDAMTFGQKVKLISQLTAEMFNDRRDQHIAPREIPAQPSPPAAAPASSSSPPSTE